MRYKIKPQAKVIFSEKAFIKMVALVEKYDTEVAWHGVTRRIDKSTFEVVDILVYPQTVTSVTVKSKSAESYSKWLQEAIFEIDDDCDLKLQGHSHANMCVVPSFTDKKDREDTLKILSKNSYYIFMILNKSLEMEIEIYDFFKKEVYKNREVSVEIGNGEYAKFLKEARKLIK